MIRIMIVDDEVWVRTSIKNKIKWNQELVLCAEASDGFEGIQMAEIFHPNIIITDVRMPVLDGIEMMKKIKLDVSNVESIFISGYSEFQYVKEAMDLNSSGYVLKPIKKDELLGTLEKAIQKVHQNQAMKQVSQTSYEILNTYLKKLYDEEPINIKNLNVILKKLEFYHGNYTVFLLRLLEVEYEYLEVYQKIMKLVSDCSKSLTFTVFSSSNHIFGIFVAGSKEFDAGMYARILRKNMKDQLQLGISITIGRTAMKLDEIKLSMKVAKEGLSYLHLFSCHEIILPLVGREKKEKVNFPDHYKKELIESVYTSNYEKIEEICSYLKEYIVKDHKMTVYQIHYLLYLLLGDLMRLSYERKISEHIMDEGIQLMDEISPLRLNKGTIERFFYYCCKISDCMKEDSGQTIYFIIQKAKLYIEEHYNDTDISLRRLAEMFHVNQCYLSTSFKKHTNKNFNDYLNYTRIEHAKRLLKDNHLNISQVTKLVGVNDLGYFGKLFKRYTGYMPSDYQKSI